MIGNIETIEIKIDADCFQFTKLYARDGYGLYMNCLAILSPLLTSVIQKGNNNKGTTTNILPVDLMLNHIVGKFDFNETVRLLKLSALKKNYKDLTDSDYNLMSPILIMELLAHVLKINVVCELAKKDFGQIVARLFGSENSFAHLSEKVKST